MLNVISTQIEKTKVCGPYKVLHNLLKGLELIDYPYVINRALNSTEHVWIQDDKLAVKYIKSIDVKKLYGPNLYNHPRKIPTGIEFLNGIYLQPCDWARNIWLRMGFNACPIKIWPVGIDTYKFNDRSHTKKPYCNILIYHKKRNRKELLKIEEIARNSKYTYNTIEYGNYTEQQYIDAIDNCRYIVWHGCPESQGIALLEALSMNKPILVVDATNIQDEVEYDRTYTPLLNLIEVTSAPYFSDKCGIKIKSISELQNGFELMEENLSEFSPREYIKQYLSLEKQAKEFVKILEISTNPVSFNPHDVNKAWKKPYKEQFGEYMQRIKNKLLRRS